MQSGERGASKGKSIAEKGREWMRRGRETVPHGWLEDVWVSMGAGQAHSASGTLWLPSFHFSQPCFHTASANAFSCQKTTLMTVEKAPVLEPVFRRCKFFPYSSRAPPSSTSHGKMTEIKPVPWQVVQHLGDIRVALNNRNSSELPSRGLKHQGKSRTPPTWPFPQCPGESGVQKP